MPFSSIQAAYQGKVLPRCRDPDAKVPALLVSSLKAATAKCAVSTILLSADPWYCFLCQLAKSCNSSAEHIAILLNTQATCPHLQTATPMRLFELALLSAPFFTTARAASSSDDTEEPVLPPCTVKSSITNSFFDLSRINIQPPAEDAKKGTSAARDYSWHARGYDYGANFTLNICGPVIEPMQDVVGIDKKDMGRIGGFYEMDGKNYSLG